MTPFTRIAGAIGAGAAAAFLAMVPLGYVLPGLAALVGIAALGAFVIAHIGLLYRLRAERWVLVVPVLEILPFVLPPLADGPARRVVFLLATILLGAAVVVTDGLPLGTGLLLVIGAPLVFLGPVALYVLPIGYVALYVAMWLERPAARYAAAP